MRVRVRVRVHVRVCLRVCVINARMPDRPASSQAGTGLKKLTMPEQVRYRTKLTQSGIFLVRYWTKIRDAGMPMPALVFWMPMPSYDVYIYIYIYIYIYTSKPGESEQDWNIHTTRGGHVVIPQIEGSTSTTAIPQRFKEMLLNNCNSAIAIFSEVRNFKSAT